MVVNTQEILPMPVITGSAEYPTDCLDRIRKEANDVITLDATQIAHECGTYRAANVVMIGVLAKRLPFSYENWMNVIESNVKPKFVEMNKEAFKRGYEL